MTTKDDSTTEQTSDGPKTITFAELMACPRSGYVCESRFLPIENPETFDEFMTRRLGRGYKGFVSRWRNGSTFDDEAMATAAAVLTRPL